MDIRDTLYYPLEEIQHEFLKYAPAYAQEEAKEAISKVFDLQMQGVLLFCPSRNVTPSRLC